jgi:hypothetical protein
MRCWIVLQRTRTRANSTSYLLHSPTAATPVWGCWWRPLHVVVTLAELCAENLPGTLRELGDLFAVYLPEEETNAEETGSGDDRRRAADVHG